MGVTLFRLCWWCTHLVDEDSIDILRLSEHVLDIMLILLGDFVRRHLAHGPGQVEGHVIAALPDASPRPVIPDAVRVTDVAHDADGSCVHGDVIIRQNPLCQVPACLEPGARVRHVRQETRLGEGGPDVVVPGCLVGRNDHTGSLSDIKVHATRYNGGDFYAIQLYYR